MENPGIEPCPKQPLIEDGENITQDQYFLANRQLKLNSLPQIVPSKLRPSAVSRITALDSRAVEVAKDIYADENEKESLEISGKVEMPPEIKELVSDVMEVIPRYLSMKGLKSPVLFNPERVACVDAGLTEDEDLKRIFTPVSNPDGTIRRTRGVWSPFKNAIVIDKELMKEPLEFFDVLVHESIHMQSHNHNHVDEFDEEHKKINIVNVRSGVSTHLNGESNMSFNALNEVMVEGFTKNFISGYWDVFKLVKDALDKEVEMVQQRMSSGDFKTQEVGCVSIKPFGVVLGNQDAEVQRIRDFSSSTYRQYDREYMKRLGELAKRHGVETDVLLKDLSKEFRKAFFTGSFMSLFRKLNQYGISPREFKEMDDEVVMSVEKIRR